MKRLIKPFIVIPNLPFIIAVSIYLVITLYKNTGSLELNGKYREDIQKCIREIYPRSFRYFIAIFFYVLIVINYL